MFDVIRYLFYECIKGSFHLIGYIYGWLIHKFRVYKVAIIRCAVI
jgi:hypothetical protein